MKFKTLFIFTIIIANFAIITHITNAQTDNALVSADWLQKHISDDNIVILDIRSQKAFENGHIPNAIFSDYSLWRINKKGLPGFLPDTTHIQSLIRSAGIDENSQVVIISGVDKDYDFGRAARVYWTLKISRLEKISILDGGISSWISAGHDTTSEASSTTTSNYTIKSYDTSLLATKKSTKDAIKNKSYVIVDARPKDFFEGYLKHAKSKFGGTIKNSINLSQFDFIAKDGTIKSKAELEKIVTSNKHVSIDKKYISFCNTGHWAATDWFVLSEVLGYETALYDGSFVDWSTEKNPTDNIRSRRELKAYEKKKENN